MATSVPQFDPSVVPPTLDPFSKYKMFVIPQSIVFDCGRTNFTNIFGSLLGKHESTVKNQFGGLNGNLSLTIILKLPLLRGTFMM